jgi:hypothetical protein
MAMASSQDSLVIRNASGMPSVPPANSGTPLGSKYALQEPERFSPQIIFLIVELILGKSRYLSFSCNDVDVV